MITVSHNKASCSYIDGRMLYEELLAWPGLSHSRVPSRRTWSPLWRECPPWPGANGEWRPLLSGVYVSSLGDDLASRRVAGISCHAIWSG